MKKIIATLALLLGFVTLASAIPARPGARPHRQPDGTVITLTTHGDEYCHWVTDQSGNIVEKGEDGFWRPSGKSISQHRTRLQRNAVQYSSIWSSYDDPPVTNFGDRKILAILINFTDSTFVIDNPRQKFHNLLNQQGYSYDGGFGSVRDYYIENSSDQYRPTFDVYGPVTLTHSSQYYDQTTSVAQALYEACGQLDSQVNFGDYDTDGDGTIDMILLYYAGHNEAEGAGEESIWPHQSSGYGTFDGVKIGKYFCTSELRGDSGTQMCGIGTTTHEFAHSLGLPDFYDTDYEENGGINATTNYYDVMSLGSYLEDGKCPPYFNAVERNMLGWMPRPESITTSGQKTLSPVQNNAAYLVQTSNPGEFFVLEYRGNSGWDAGLPDYGLAIYHVDQSQNLVYGSYTANYLWNNTNKINAFYPHPCFYIMTTSGGIPTSRAQWYNMLFGGSSGVSSISLKAWSGESVGLSLSGITISSGTARFQATYTTGRSLGGVIKDTSGNPVAGAQVVLSKSAYPFAGAPSILPTDLVTVSASDGTYNFDFEENASYEHILTVRKDGFFTVSQNITLEARSQKQDITIIGRGERPKAEITKVETDGTLRRMRLSSSTGDYAAAIRFTADEISNLGYAGAKITALYFAISDCTYSSAYALVYFGSERVLNGTISSVKTDAYTGVDLSGADLIIPEGKDVYIGYGLAGLQGSSSVYPFYVRDTSGDGGSYYMSNFTGGGSNWITLTSGYAFEIYVDIELPAVEDDVASFGVAYIHLENSIPVVVPASGKTLKDVTWYLDGAPVSTPAAVTGVHTYKAVLRYYDGTSETLWYDVQ